MVFRLRQKFVNLLVSLPENSGNAFLLIAAFGRCKVRLSDASVGFLLQSCLGGHHSNFHCLELEDRIFKFAISSQEVGFWVYKLKNYSCEAFKSYADAVRCEVIPLSGANRVPLNSKATSDHRSSVFSRLGFQKPSDFGGVYNKGPLPSRPTNGSWSRCLSKEHSRPSCHEKIRCHVCHCLGHIAVFCFARKVQALAANSGNKVKGITPPKGFHFGSTPMTCGLGPSEAPRFGTFAEFAKLSGKIDPLFIPPLTTVHWDSSHPSTAPPRSTDPPTTASAGTTGSPLSAMAYQRVDPTLFIPLGLHWEEVPNRVQVLRAVSVQAPARNEDVAIAIMDQMPGHHIHFVNIREILGEFLVDERHLCIKDIQPCPMGQAYVRFFHVYDRDHLVLNGPYDFGDITIRFVKHDEGRNHRALNFNQECWLLLLNFHLDYREQEYIEDAIKPFARLISWEREPNRLAGVVVHARAADLKSVPHFIPCTIGEGFQGHSWTIQCEILQHHMLGGQPADEDPPPGPDHVGPGVPFDSFGFGNVNLDLNLNAGNEEVDPMQEDIAEIVDPVPEAEAIAHPEPVPQLGGQEQVNDEPENAPPLFGEEENGLDLNIPVHVEEDPVPVLVEQPINFLVDDVPLDQLVEGYNSGTISLWSQHFAPTQASNIFKVPTECADFFTLLLVSPHMFEWASEFIRSKAMNFLSEGMITMPFSLPASCPKNLAKGCVTPSPSISEEEGSPPCNKQKRKNSFKTSTPIVETEVRRSSRLREQAKGSKRNNCTDKHCLARSVAPPSISLSVIRNLGASFCKVSETELTDERLQKKAKPAPIARKQKVSKPPKIPDENNKKNESKPKK
ncbi:hypothetical protein BS78_02G149600 [Paspalum vaginatum]|nr:hypothetical protein BS78_02G149600 [Paspalum vaginatum]